MAILLCFICVLHGNPGTGKTSFARILGQIFKEEHILPNGNFVEIHARDLIGKYVGHTAPETKKAIKRAWGGILFIDEAYSLCSDRMSFESEAIATLVKEMEDNREKICIIFAGYRDEMNEFIHKNQGLVSRIQYYIDFPDYTNEELYQIFDTMRKKEHYRISSQAKEMVQDYLAKGKNEKSFSNGRFVRNLFEKIKIEQANRTAGLNSNSNMISKDDIEQAIICSKGINIEKRAIGF